MKPLEKEIKELEWLTQKIKKLEQSAADEPIVELDSLITVRTVQSVVSALQQEQTRQLAAVKDEKQAKVMEGYDAWIDAKKTKPFTYSFKTKVSAVKPVLVTYLSVNDGKPYDDITAIYCEDEEWRFFDEDKNIKEMEIIGAEVTAWQPLPRPYGDTEQ